MDRAFDAVDALAAIIDAVGTGQIAPSEAAALASLVAAYARIIDVAELEERLDNIEKDLRALKTLMDRISRHRIGKCRGAPLCRAEGTRRETKAIAAKVVPTMLGVTRPL